MKLFLYADFCKIIPTTNKHIVEELDKEIKDCRVLFVPLATTNKSYVSKCYNCLISLGFLAENIVSISPMIDNENFDVVFVCGGNNAVLKEKLINWNWWNKLKNLIVNNTLYIGDSAGAVILGKGFEFSLEYEEYNGKLTDYSGFDLISKYIIVHYSLKKLRSDGIIADATDYFNLHHDAIINLGRENCLTIGNNEFFKLTDDGSKIFSYNWEEIQENYLREKKC